MTRITNFGRKRTYLEAGFDTATEAVSSPSKVLPANADAAASNSGPSPAEDVQPSRKKRKRSKKSKTAEASDTPAQSTSAPSIPSPNEQTVQADGSPIDTRTPRQKRRDREKREKEKRANAKLAKTRPPEIRRLKRIAQKNSDTTCFACRQKGHAAKDCPKANQNSGESLNDSPAIGICYRCGASNHTLSRCKKPVDPGQPMPFASCFVCSGKGHLASGCPQNADKGVYPNGGSCKLCGDKSHLAKNCTLRKESAHLANAPALVGVGRDVGADEDDFHNFKRQTTQVEREERREEKVKRRMDLKAGKHSGVIKAFGKSPTIIKKKVVSF